MTNTNTETRIAELTARIKASAWPRTLAGNICRAIFGHARAAEPEVAASICHRIA